MPKVNLKIKKFSVHVLGENPAGFWNCTTYWETEEEARVQAGKELIDDEVYSIWIEFPDGKKDYILKGDNNDQERRNYFD